MSIDGKTLIEQVQDRLEKVTEEIVVAVRSQEQKKIYSRIMDNCIFVIDRMRNRGPLNGIWTGLRRVTNEKVVVVGCDTPFISSRVFLLLSDLIEGYDAAIPRWPNGYIEPLHSVYRSDSCRTATRRALQAGRTDMRTMILEFQKPIYLSTEIIRKLDPELTMFTNVNSYRDLKQAERILALQQPKPPAHHQLRHASRRSTH